MGEPRSDCALVDEAMRIINKDVENKMRLLDYKEKAERVLKHIDKTLFVKDQVQLAEERQLEANISAFIAKRLIEAENKFKERIKDLADAAMKRATRDSMFFSQSKMLAILDALNCSVDVFDAYAPCSVIIGREKLATIKRIRDDLKETLS